MQLKTRKSMMLIFGLALTAVAAVFLLQHLHFSVHAQTNHSPVFPSTETGVRHIPENTPQGTDVGDPFTATDEDGHTLTYLILDKLDGASFDINSTTGQLRTKAPLDYETKRSYSLVIAVHDGIDEHEGEDHRLDAALSVIVIVTDVEEEDEEETPTESACVSNGAVSDDANSSELVRDCEVLITMRDTLARSVSLDWSLDTSIVDWEGITVAGTPMRVTRLELPNRGLSGTIPPIIELLSGLRVIDLRDNSLRGQIPFSMARIESLEELYLDGNSLTGCIPDGLDSVSLSDLSSLGLPECEDEEEIRPPVIIPPPVPTPPSDSDCLESIQGAGTFTGSWDDTCHSEYRPQDADGGGHTGSAYYARFYTFMLDAPARRVTITLTSDDDPPVDTFLYLSPNPPKSRVIFAGA